VDRVTLVDDSSKLDTTLRPDGQQKTYLVLSAEECAKGFVRPVRTTYRHVGKPIPVHPLRDLTPEEERFNEGSAPEDRFVKFEPNPDGSGGKFWTQADVDAVGKGCGTTTTMGLAIAETYARVPGFYGGTFCCACGTHLPVGKDGEFVWDDGSRVGT
jgi:hypothetical protein